MKDIALDRLGLICFSSLTFPHVIFHKLFSPKSKKTGSDHNQTVSLFSDMNNFHCCFFPINQRTMFPVCQFMDVVFICSENVPLLPRHMISDPGTNWFGSRCFVPRILNKISRSLMFLLFHSGLFLKETFQKSLIWSVTMTSLYRHAEV